MAKRYIFAVLSIVVAGLLVFGIYKELDKSKKALLAEVAEKQKVADLVPVWLKTNHEILKLQDDLDTIAELRVKNGCVADTIDQAIECEHYNQRFNSLQAQLQDTVHRLQLANKSPVAIATAVANIKVLAENPSLEVQFKDIQDNMYSNNGKNVDIYGDSNGMQYLVEPATNKVVQFGPAAGPSVTVNYRMTPRLTTAQLKQKAEDYLMKHINDFTQVKNSVDFTYTTTSKDGMAYAFRWNANIKPAREDMAPFVQVVLSPAGDVISFNDTRSLYQ